MKAAGIVLIATVTAGLWPGVARAEDQARKVCMPDARKLCPAAVRALNRKAAEQCLYRQIDRTSPACHAMILQVRADRAVLANRK